MGTTGDRDMDERPGLLFKEAGDFGQRPHVVGDTGSHGRRGRIAAGLGQEPCGSN